MGDWPKDKGANPREIQYRPARVLMQDFTGVPAVVDLAAMRDVMKSLGGDPQKINPQVPVHLVIDHSVMVDEFGSPGAFEKNVALEYERNMERRSEEHPSELQSLMRIAYAVFCLTHKTENLH